LDEAAKNIQNKYQQLNQPKKIQNKYQQLNIGHQAWGR
jgi:hypothetical protein